MLTGCGSPHGSTALGFCDPRWSECLGQAVGINSCDDYCSSIGKRCCDRFRVQNGLCAQQELCITSRNYPVGWGLESWHTRAECQDPLSLGVGQLYCDSQIDKTPAYRCCCLAK